VAITTKKTESQFCVNIFVVLLGKIKSNRFQNFVEISRLMVFKMGVVRHLGF